MLHEGTELVLQLLQRPQELGEVWERRQSMHCEAFLDVQQVLRRSHGTIDVWRAMHVRVVDDGYALRVRAEAESQVVEAQQRASWREQPRCQHFVGCGTEQHPRATTRVVIAQDVSIAEDVSEKDRHRRVVVLDKCENTPHVHPRVVVGEHDPLDATVFVGELGEGPHVLQLPTLSVPIACVHRARSAFVLLATLSCHAAPLLLSRHRFQPVVDKEDAMDFGVGPRLLD
mmetsp:Transcript_2612/g.10094  ORF Transcript_2612/g.10094 Transcript_2612/m.10094 type:complete len:229 (-) Transcript_2612:396-1082(-)